MRKITITADEGTVALRKESVDRNPELYKALSHVRWSLSARRAWIEILLCRQGRRLGAVALRKESVDRNLCALDNMPSNRVALRKESVDRN